MIKVQSVDVRPGAHRQQPIKRKPTRKLKTGPKVNSVDTASKFNSQVYTDTLKKPSLLQELSTSTPLRSVDESLDNQDNVGDNKLDDMKYRSSRKDIKAQRSIRYNVHDDEYDQNTHSDSDANEDQNTYRDSNGLLHLYQPGDEVNITISYAGLQSGEIVHVWYVIYTTITKNDLEHGVDSGVPILHDVYTARKEGMAMVTYHL